MLPVGEFGGFSFVALTPDTVDLQSVVSDLMPALQFFVWWRHLRLSQIMTVVDTKPCLTMHVRGLLSVASNERGSFVLAVERQLEQRLSPLRRLAAAAVGETVG